MGFRNESTGNYSSLYHVQASVSHRLLLTRGNNLQTERHYFPILSADSVRNDRESDHKVTLSRALEVNVFPCGASGPYQSKHQPHAMGRAPATPTIDQHPCAAPATFSTATRLVNFSNKDDESKTTESGQIKITSALESTLIAIVALSEEFKVFDTPGPACPLH